MRKNYKIKNKPYNFDILYIKNQNNFLNKFIESNTTNPIEKDIYGRTPLDFYIDNKQDYNIKIPQKIILDALKNINNYYEQDTYMSLLFRSIHKNKILNFKTKHFNILIDQTIIANKHIDQKIVFWLAEKSNDIKLTTEYWEKIFNHFEKENSKFFANTIFVHLLENIQHIDQIFTKELWKKVLKQTNLNCDIAKYKNKYTSFEDEKEGPRIPFSIFIEKITEGYTLGLDKNEILDTINTIKTKHIDIEKMKTLIETIKLNLTIETTLPIKTIKKNTQKI